MPITAKLQHLRIAPRKVRLAADLIRGKKLEEAENILNFTTKKASLPLLKLLKQAEANAKNNFQIDASNLFVSKILVDEGPKYKRWEPRARGQAYEIQKKTSHVKIVLDEIVKKPTAHTQPLKGSKLPTRQARKVKKVEKLFKSEVAKPSSSAASGVAEGEEEKILKPEKPLGRSWPGEAKIRPEKEIAKPKTVKGLKKIFQRKVF